MSSLIKTDILMKSVIRTLIKEVLFTAQIFMAMEHMPVGHKIWFNNF